MTTRKGRKCIGFDANPADQISIRPTSNPTATLLLPQPSSHYPEIECQNHVAVERKSCIRVDSFEMLKRRINRAYADETLVFCPFDIKKAPNEEIVLKSSIYIACNEKHKCRIKGPRSHIRVKGEFAQVHIQGFVFEGAGSSKKSTPDAAIHIKSSAVLGQSICECIFTLCKGRSRGVAVLTERRTDVFVSNSSFRRNESSEIGVGIFARGKMLISETEFVGNKGTGNQGGSAIGCSAVANLQLRNNRK